MKKSYRFFQIIFCIALTCGAGAALADVQYKGVNLSGAEASGCNTRDARYGYQYVYPSAAFMDAFLAAGMNTFRLPFCWERLQPGALGAFDAAELDRLDQAVRHLTERGAYVILDPHNYAAYRGNAIGKGTSNAMFADLWRRLAAHYAGNARVIFGLMNEPINIDGNTWLPAANAAIAAIRTAGAGNLVLVPGVAWSGAHSWSATSYGAPNAVTSLQIRDPGNNYAIEVHQYLDKDSSGTSADCLDERIGVTRITPFMDWLRQHDRKAFLGEFAAGTSPVCLRALYNMLDAIRNNGDLWLGWTYWSAGPWQANYMFNLQPKSDPAKVNQIDVIQQFLHGCGGAQNCPPTAPSLRSVE